MYTNFNYLNEAADGEFLDLYLKKLFKKVLFINSLEFLKENEQWNEISTDHLFELASSLEINIRHV